MKYAVVKTTDGNFNIASEWNDNLKGAREAWHAECKNLRNDTSCLVYTCKVVDENWSEVGKYSEHVDRTPVPEPNIGA